MRKESTDKIFFKNFLYTRDIYGRWIYILSSPKGLLNKAQIVSFSNDATINFFAFFQ